MLTIAPSYLTDHQHIRVVKMAGAGMRLLRLLMETNIGHAFPGVNNVAGCSPTVTANFACPVPAIAHTILAKAEHNIAVIFIKRSAHYLIWFFVIINCGFLWRDVAVRTPVVFQIVDAPVSV